MNKKVMALVLLTSLPAMHALAINKCTDGSGKMVFQDTPCTGKGEVIKITPASGRDASPPPLTNPPPALASAAKSSTQQQYETLKDERVRREKWVVLNDAKRNLESTRLKCESEQKELAASKAWSKNNLAGATRDSSISQEMSAAAMVCDSRMRSKEKEVEAAEKVCAEIKCIALY